MKPIEVILQAAYEAMERERPGRASALKITFGQALTDFVQELVAYVPEEDRPELLRTVAGMAAMLNRHRQ